MCVHCVCYVFDMKNFHNVPIVCAACAHVVGSRASHMRQHGEVGTGWRVLQVHGRGTEVKAVGDSNLQEVS